MLESERVDGLILLKSLRLYVIPLDEFTIDEKSFDQTIFAIEQLSISILHVELPIAFVEASIFPVHFSISAS